jgi:hypothetical protein
MLTSNIPFDEWTSMVAHRTPQNPSSFHRFDIASCSADRGSHVRFLAHQLRLRDRHGIADARFYEFPERRNM